MRRCPRCGMSAKIELSRCGCGLKLHTPKDCRGCAELSGAGARCRAFKSKADPILQDDGTCHGYKKAPWIDVKQPSPAGTGEGH